MLTKEDIKHLVARVMNGQTAEDVCSHIKLDQTFEDFNRAMTNAIFDIWIHVGDSGFNRKGYREAFDSVEHQFFPKEKEEKDDTFNEHFPYDGYF